MKRSNILLGVLAFCVSFLSCHVGVLCHPELGSGSSSHPNNTIAQTKADTVKLLSSLSVPELISVGHEVMRLAKQQGLANTCMEKYFLDVLESVVYEDIYVYDTPAPVVYEDVYVYDTPAPVPVSVDFSVESSGVQKIDGKTFTQQLAEFVIAVFTVGAILLVAAFLIVALSNSSHYTVSSRPVPVLIRRTHVITQPAPRGSVLVFRP